MIVSMKVKHMTKLGETTPIKVTRAKIENKRSKLFQKQNKNIENIIDSK